jgi:hypothetical protein
MHAEADPGRRLPSRLRDERIRAHKRAPPPPQNPQTLVTSTNRFAMAERLQQFLSHLKPGSAPLAALSQKNPDDVVVTLAVRTPLTKAKKGGLRDTSLEHMLLRLYQVLISLAE